MASSPEAAPAEGGGDQSSPPVVAGASPPPASDTATPPPAESPPNSPPPPDSPPPTPTSPPPALPVSPPPSSPPPSPPASSPPPPPTSTPAPPVSPPPSTPTPPPPSLTPPQSQTPPPASISSPPPPATTSPTPPAIGSPPTAVVTNPPPPAPPSRSPTPPSLPRPAGAGSSPPSSIEPNTSSDSNNGAIIGGIIAGGVVILAVFIICLMCLRKKKKPKYYMDPLPPTKAGEQYYNQWNSPHGDQVVKIPPPPGFMGTPLGGDGGGGWGAPPLPPQANTSSEFSSNYSGQHPTPMAAPSPIGGMTQFTYEELAATSGGFSQSNLLGQGGFGFVHKGILPDRREVAIKSLKAGSGQGEREFQAEVEIISRVHHRHLVSLVGYCIANEQRLLVYEFVPNKTLEFHLHGKGQPVMDWGTRLRIAVGSAKGLAYLHEDCHPRIIHRDIKAANILLDYNFEAMVADFGLAKLTSDNYTHVSTRVMGTFGYLAPEYASSGKLTEKSDVFSFGVMLLELITGRRPVDLTNKMMEDSLVDWARPLIAKATENDDYSELIDPRLEDNYAPHELARMVSCAGASIRHSARRRPRMSQIVRALEGDSSLDDLNEGVKPGQSTAYNPTGQTDAYDTRAYNADIMKFRKMVMTSKELNSSEYGTTSEYGLNPSSSSDEMGGVSREVKRF